MKQAFALQANMIDRSDTAGCNGKGYSGGGLSYTLTKLDRHAVATIENMKPELPEIVGTLSDGAHMGGGLNGQDAYSGRIIPTNSMGASGEGCEGAGQQHERGTPDSDPSRRFL